MAKAAKKVKKTSAKKSAARKASRSAPRKAAAPRAAKPSQPKWKPQGQQQLVVNLVFRDAGAAIEFYKSVFGAKELMRMSGPGGRIGHAELRIGDTVVYLNDDMGSMGGTQPAGPDHRPTASLMLYVPDVDATFNRAVQAGARPTMPLADQFWGDRMGGVADPFGQAWMLGTHTRDVSPEDTRKGAEEWARQAQSHGQGGQPPPGTAAQ
jgi:PhnB protein